VEIDFDVGIQNALSANRELTAEYRAQATELQRIVRLERQAANIVQRTAPIGGNLRLQPSGVRPPSSSPPPGIPQIAPSGRTGGIALRAGIDDMNEQRIFNARFDRAVEKLQFAAKARGFGAELESMRFGGKQVKGLLGGLRSISRGALSAQGLKSFAGDAASLGLASGSPLGGIAGAGLGRVAGAIGAPILAGLTGAKLALDVLASSVQSGRDRGETINKPARAAEKLFKAPELRGLPGLSRFKEAVYQIDFKSKPIRYDSYFREVFGFGPTLIDHDATIERDAKRREKIVTDFQKGAKERPDLMAAYISDMFNGDHVTNANTKSVMNAVIEAMETGQLTGTQVEAINAMVRIGQDRQDAVTVKQRRDEREVQARTKAIDEIMAKSRQEWNPN